VSARAGLVAAAKIARSRAEVSSPEHRLLGIAMLHISPVSLV
jgi:hypothetical protein